MSNLDVLGPPASGVSSIDDVHFHPVEKRLVPRLSSRRRSDRLSVMAPHPRLPARPTGQGSRVRLTFPAASFATPRDIFVERYGQPTATETQPVRRNAGVEYQNVVLIWNGTAIEARLQKYSGGRGVSGRSSVARRADQSSRGREEEGRDDVLTAHDEARLTFSAGPIVILLPVAHSFFMFRPQPTHHA